MMQNIDDQLDQLLAQLDTQTTIKKNTTFVNKSGSQNLILGIDAGGSKTKAALWSTEVAVSLQKNNASEKEKLLAAKWEETFSGLSLDVIDPLSAGNQLAGIFETAADAVQLKMTNFFEQTRLIIGLAGLDTAEDRQHAQFWLDGLLFQLRVEPLEVMLIPDVELALFSGNRRGEGIVLIAGTGSNCYGRSVISNSSQSSSDEQQVVTDKAGGVSQYFSDEGSGFMIGWEALHVVGKMQDGRLPHSPLYSQILANYDATDFGYLKRAILQSSNRKRMVAKAAPVVQSLAEMGDAVCQKIINQQVTELARMVNTVAWQLNPEFSQTKDFGSVRLPMVYLAGGLFSHDYFTSLVREQLQIAGFEVSLQRISNPVVGALAL